MMKAMQRRFAMVRASFCSQRRMHRSLRRAGAGYLQLLRKRYHAQNQIPRASAAPQQSVMWQPPRMQLCGELVCENNPVTADSKAFLCRSIHNHASRNADRETSWRKFRGTTMARQHETRLPVEGKDSPDNALC
jgi:hypothetical protein